MVLDFFPHHVRRLAVAMGLMLSYDLVMKKQPRRTFASSHFFFKCIIVASWNNNKLPVLTMISSKKRICKCSHFRSVLFSTAVDYSIRTVGSYGFRRVLPAWIQQWRQKWSFIIYHQTASLIIGIRTFHISNVQRFSFSSVDIWKSLSIDM